jgi:hypothetical protein
MSLAEIARRARQQTMKVVWWPHHARRGGPGPVHVLADRGFSSTLPAGTAAAVPPLARAKLLGAADDLLAGRGEVLGLFRTDLVAPDWFRDPATGIRAPSDRYAFTINHRDPSVTGDVKQLWELSRHHHLTILAAAWYVTGDDRYAERVAAQLRSWWRDNLFLSGVHWTSGIEVGLRLIAWAWIRRLLDGWPGVEDLFEHNDLAVTQLCGHQRYLAAFRSVGSSANNHVIAELSGQIVGACAFPWYEESRRWRESAVAALSRELERNTFPTGVNRELATDYHAFVAELVLLAAAEASSYGQPLPSDIWARLCRMADVGAALADACGEPPRQGDSDDGRALVVDGASNRRWAGFLDLAAVGFGPLPWWPEVPATVAGTLVGALLGPVTPVVGRPSVRPSHFPDAGITVLRTAGTDAPEIWCRCDGGPHGFLSIAGHAHSDALAIEVRHGGVEVLVDPGTYCYHAEPDWRRYFRSTIAHNTIELAGRDQSDAGGPFLWVRHATATEHAVCFEDGRSSWTATHDGYLALDPPAEHTRTIVLEDHSRTLEIRDVLRTTGTHSVRLAFHLGPTVAAAVDGARLRLWWQGAAGPASAVLRLPGDLEWSAHRGETGPILGWYSQGFGTRMPTTTIVGTGTCGAGLTELVSALVFSDGAGSEASCLAQGVLPAS